MTLSSTSSPSSSLVNSSRLFEGYRSLGLVSSDVPHLIRYVDKINKIQIVTAVGRSFLVFNEKLQLVETCVAHSSDITVLAADSLYLYTAAGNEIFAWKYGHKWKVKSFIGADRPITHLLVFGPQLLAIDQSNTLFLWDIDSQSLSLTIPFGDSKQLTTRITEAIDSGNEDDDDEVLQTENSSQPQVSAILHPATYINKILLGFTDGSLQLWNVAKQKLIYRFPGWGSKITKLVQAPALHICAIGHESGQIVLHHLKEDQTLMKFYQEWGPVGDLSFRTDDAATIPILVSSSATGGHLAVWNLDAQRLESQMRDLHMGPIVGAGFVAKQPLLVTNSADNSLKVWVFDDLQTNGRMLYQREGHRLPPTKIRFYGNRGQYILSSGLDSSLRAFFIYSERKNRCLGHASYNRKQAKKKGVARDSAQMEPITEFAFETTREKEWDNLVAIHRNTPFVTSWSFDKMKMGEHRLIHERFAGSGTLVQPEAITMTSCGNFVIIGYNTGHVERFNIQSGFHRCSYESKDGAPAHKGIVRGVLADGLNQVVVSGGSDSKLNFWKFGKGQPIGQLKVSAPVNQLHLQRDNNLLAVSLDNFHIIIVDLETKKVARRFTKHQSRITDMTFDSDGRRLYVASMDSLVYVWDMMSGLLVDVFRTRTPVVSLTFSPSGEFLATAHVGDLGIYLWANLSVYSVVNLSPIEVSDVYKVAKMIELPTIRSDDEDKEEEVEDGGEDDEEQLEVPIDYQYHSPEQLSIELVTLSSLSSSRWKNLLKLDLIRKRNKPTEPMEKPKSAPFFLPTISGLTPQFDLGTADEDSSGREKRKFALQFMSQFVRVLEQCGTRDPEEGALDYRACFDELKSYGPSKVDAELRTLGPDSTGGSTRYLNLFLDMIDWALQTNRDFELAQSYLGLAVKIHLEDITKDKELINKCRHLAAVTDKAWDRLQNDFDKSICLINYLRNALV